MSSPEREALKAPLEAALAARLERRLRELVPFRALEFHPPAPGSEPFYDGRSLSFPLSHEGADIALVVLEGVERPPDPQALLNACAELLAAAGTPRPPAEPRPPEVAHANHVTHVLPLGKLVLAVGEGARPGGRVLIWEQRSGGGERVCKAEAELVSVEGGRALACIVSRSDPFVRVKPGDLISAVEGPGEAPAEPSGRGLEAFRAALEGEARGWEVFCVLMARLEGGELIRTRHGVARLERLLADMTAALLSFGGAGTVVGREGAELLLAGFPGKGAAEALVAHGLLAELAAQLSARVTAGCAGYPAWGFERAEVVDNARKALDHARLLGQGQTACFNAVSLNVSGDALYASGDLEGAAREYLRALDIDCEDTNVLNSLGVCYAGLGDFEAAKAQFRRAVAARPGEVMAHYNLGFAHLKEGQREEALASFAAALAADPANFEARFQLGKLMLEAGRPIEAREHLSAAAQIESRPYLYRYLGDCLLLLGESAEAAGHYKRAVRVNPEDAHSLSQLAAIYLELGTDLEVAVSLLRKSVELQPTCALHRERLEAALARLE